MPPPNKPNSPGIPTDVRLSTQLSPTGKYPANVEPKKLDNPPLTRSIVPGATPPQYVLTDPFSGLGVLEILNIKAAMHARLEHLDTPQANPDNVAATKRVLQIINAKLDPKPKNTGIPILPVPKPTLVLMGSVPIPPPLEQPLEVQVATGDLGPGAQATGDK